MDSKGKPKPELALSNSSATRKTKHPTKTPSLKLNQFKLGKSGSPRATKMPNTDRAPELGGESQPKQRQYTKIDLQA